MSTNEKSEGNAAEVRLEIVTRAREPITESFSFGRALIFSRPLLLAAECDTLCGVSPEGLKGSCGGAYRLPARGRVRFAPDLRLGRVVRKRWKLAS